MAQITQGRVVYARTVQPAQYESKRAEVELTFVLAEGESLAGTLDMVAELAKTKALEMVGLKNVRPVEASGSTRKTTRPSS